MLKKSRPVTQAEIDKIKKLLRSARTRYEDKVLMIDQVWSKLKPHDYKARKMIIDLTTDLIDIDANLKVWEQKLSSQ